MCNFFSFVTKGDGIPIYFSIDDIYDINLSGNPRSYEFNSHSSITHFKGLDDDSINKYEYNFSYGFEYDSLSLDSIVIPEDTNLVKNNIRELFKNFTKTMSIGILESIYEGRLLICDAYNMGNNNKGRYNIGDYNFGCYNIGNNNMGRCNIGNYNKGSNNIGDFNSLRNPAHKEMLRPRNNSTRSVFGNEVSPHDYDRFYNFLCRVYNEGFVRNVRKSKIFKDLQNLPGYDWILFCDVTNISLNDRIKFGKYYDKKV